MRDIKFRGRLVGGDAWAYGDLLQSTKTRIIDNGFGVITHGYNFVELSAFEVDPETVGQYTGLKDKNGVEIYEGDIFKHPTSSKYKYVVEHVIEYGHAGVAPFMDDTGFSAYEIEIIGNIHDNLELLKEVE